MAVAAVRAVGDWQEVGTWQLIHFSLLDWLARCREIDWSRAVVDGSSILAAFGGRTDTTAGRGVPLALQLDQNHS